MPTAPSCFLWIVLTLGFCLLAGGEGVFREPFDSETDKPPLVHTWGESTPTSLPQE